MGVALIVVVAHQHDDAPLVDVLQADRRGGAQVGREGSVVSTITGLPIQASGILPSESEALGLSLSIMAPLLSPLTRKRRIPLPRVRRTPRTLRPNFGELPFHALG
jgi:hypothetical protein